MKAVQGVSFAIKRGETLGPAPEPLKVWVSDGNNPVAPDEVRKKLDTIEKRSRFE